ncbi:hypothetical protein VXS05_17530 [Photobacterium toruni]|uniref:hypothetical protein n=1 Tax=Photobacterium toruni TaxID=1935446 RepID=UPI002E1996BC|nr:hypothetical protein [Photobacterium toruni]
MTTKILDLSLEKQREIIDLYEIDCELVYQHVAMVHFSNDSLNQPDSYRNIDDPDYKVPTPEEITDVVNYLAKIHSKTILSKMLGIFEPKDPNRKINKWCKGESKIPYTAWRLMLIFAGRIVQVNQVTQLDGTKPWRYSFDEKNTQIIKRKYCVEVEYTEGGGIVDRYQLSNISAISIDDAIHQAVEIVQQNETEEVNILNCNAELTYDRDSRNYNKLR